MEDRLQKFSELCRDPMLGVAQGKLCLMNAAARLLFPNCSLGDNAADILPAHLLQEPAPSFVSSAEVDDRQFTVSALHDGDLLLLVFAAPQSTDPRGFLSDSLMNGMLSTLFNLSLSAERLRDCLDPQDPDGESYFAMLLHSYHLLNHELSNLNLIHQLSENELTIFPRNADLVALCRDIVGSAEHLIGSGLARVEFSTTLESLHATVDTPKVERMIVNLLSNALKYTPADGKIRLRLAKSGENAVISVDDNGCGIAPEVLNNVFHSYEIRLDPRNLSAAGTGGLGLGICRAIAEGHGGALILESRVGEGTSVRVMLPLARPGSEVLHSDLPIYERSGMSFLLTELADILSWTAYTEKNLD